MKLVTLTWKRCVQLGENPECRALGCQRVLGPDEKVYHTENGHGNTATNYFCRDCIENKPYIIYLLYYPGRNHASLGNFSLHFPNIPSFAITRKRSE